MIDIRAYKPEHEADLIQAISLDSDWDEFTNHQKIDAYKAALNRDLVYVAYHEMEFCGYARAIMDGGLAIYISELYVVPKWRNQKVGQFLIEQFNNEFPDLDIYALSDEDEYYEKKGYKKLGSVFKIDQDE